jgi:hypothetical protein
LSKPVNSAHRLTAVSRGEHQEDQKEKQEQEVVRILNDPMILPCEYFIAHYEVKCISRQSQARRIAGLVIE